MTAANRFIALAALPFVLVACAVLGSMAVDFEGLVFKPGERRLLHYAPETIEVRLPGADGSRRAGELSGRLRKAGLFYFGEAAPEPQPAVFQEAPPAYDPLSTKVSLIIFKGRGSLAIVDNTVVMEGDSVGGMLVKRIEQDKVLLKGKDSRWVYMEGKR